MLMTKCLKSKTIFSKSRYNLTLDTTIHQKLTESNVVQSLEKETTPTYVAGGCSYNAMRVFNVI